MAPAASDRSAPHTTVMSGEAATSGVVALRTSVTEAPDAPRACLRQQRTHARARARARTHTHMLQPRKQSGPCNLPAQTRFYANTQQSPAGPPGGNIQCYCLSASPRAQSITISAQTTKSRRPSKMHHPVLLFECITKSSINNSSQTPHGKDQTWRFCSVSWTTMVVQETLPSEPRKIGFFSFLADFPL